ncbi:MAG: SGNH/GDSL hydrolase family protein [Clostridia bacterium]|nr:SGNH/GDSL hydrolase family protein [Clostridia bacterium]
MKILFQGDSITDCGRSRENDSYLGHGYPRFVQGKLMVAEPGQNTYVNTGISGNRIVDVYARIKADIINLKPDVMSILIGINDVWHEVSRQNGVDAPKFEKIYCMLIEEVLEALPDIKIMILEPFVLKGCATIESWDFFASETKLRAEAARRVAEKYNLTFIPLQEMFDSMPDCVRPDYWAGDGVHPTAAGHELISNEWIKAYKAL